MILRVFKEGNAIRWREADALPQCGLTDVGCFVPSIDEVTEYLLFGVQVGVTHLPHGFVNTHCHCL